MNIQKKNNLSKSSTIRGEKIAVIGAGLMGRGICQSFASTGYEVSLVDLNNAILNRAMEQIEGSLKNIEEKGLLDESPRQVLGRISPETDFSKACSNATFAEEAVFENLEVKKETFAKLSSVSSPDCILATNTTSLPVSSIAGAADRQERVIGAHFWNPPQLMLAVEVVKGEKTSESVVERTVSLLRSIGKNPAVVRKDVPGQIGIRILYAMIREATSLVENGVASPEDVDRVVKEALGTRLEVLGPLELCDLSGIDLVNNVAKGLYSELDASQGPQRIIMDMVANNELGIKTGKGFYDWNLGRKTVQDTTRLRDEHLMKILKERKENQN